MDKISWILAVFVLLLVQNMAAQNQPCYTDQMVDKHKQQDPNYASELERVFTWAHDQANLTGGRRQVYTIPIVFHVILNTQTQLNSITDQEIQQQVETLDEDFRRMNADTSDTRSIFKPIAADVEVEFCLAAQDPNGNSANGITRTLSSKTEWDLDMEGDDMKFDSSNGKDAWDPDHYLNVWIVNIAGNQGGGTAGYAYLPSFNMVGSSVDGIVLDWQLGFGPTDRALTHECGHYLGLQHTWGNSGGCNDDDGISDTPPTTQATFSCSFSRNTCSNDSPDLPDQIENYMDYSSCPNMYTIEQVGVMRNILTGIRSALLGSDGCQSPNSPPVAEFTVDNQTVCPGGIVRFIDKTRNFPTSWNWSFPGATPSSSTQQNPSVIYPNGGTYDVTLTVSNAFGSDTYSEQAYITVGVGGTATILSEDFESGLSGWDFVNPDGGMTWETATVEGNSPGNQAARVHIFDYNAPGQRDGLETPVLDLSGNSSVSLSFEYAHRRYSSTRQDSLIIYVSTDGGATYPNRVFASAEDGTGSFATGTIIGNTDFVPTSIDDWCLSGSVGASCPQIDLSAYDGEDNVRIKFEVYNDYGNNIYLDNVVVSGICNTIASQGPVPDFSSSATSGCEFVTIDFTDESLNNPTSWQWSFQGGNPSTSTQQNPSVTYDSPGNYTVTLTVSNGNGTNTVSFSSYITVTEGPEASGTTTNATCAGVDDATIDLSVTGGTAPYDFLWSNGVTTQNNNSATAGVNTVTITDASGCVVTKSFTVLQNSALDLISVTNPDSAGVGKGSISVSILGGAAPYSYQWDDPGNSTSSALSGLVTGQYTVTATDNNGCQVVRTFTVGDPFSITGMTGPEELLEVNVYPNPTRELLYVQVATRPDQGIDLSVFNMLGQSVKEARYTSKKEIEIPVSLKGYQPGIYLIKLRIGEREVTKRVLLAE